MDNRPQQQTIHGGKPGSRKVIKFTGALGHPPGRRPLLQPEKNMEGAPVNGSVRLCEFQFLRHHRYPSNRNTLSPPLDICRHYPKPYMDLTLSLRINIIIVIAITS